MIRYLLDTDTLTLIQFGHAVAVRNLAAHADSEVALAAVTLQEQMRGWLAHLNKIADPDQIADWYDRLAGRMFPLWRRFELLAFPQSAQARFHSLRSLRLNIGSMDLRLAAVAMENQLTVVTRNQRDFGRVPGLKIEDWSV
jgi:tRNA(fMet)-specific endonuclease VapC